MRRQHGTKMADTGGIVFPLTAFLGMLLKAAAIVWVLYSIRMFARYFRREWRRFRSINLIRARRTVLLATFWVLMLMMIGGLAMVLRNGVVPAVTEARPETLRTYVGTSFVIAVACGLFALKVLALRIYALIEIVFAIAICLQTMSGMTDVISHVQAFGIATSAYLLVRGLDNFKKGLDERKNP